MPSTSQIGEEVGPASRKRSYDQITRSQSRSATPEQRRSKRRRTLSNAQGLLARGVSPELRTRPPAVRRFVGDGLDMRRPATPSTTSEQRQDTIDLTLDDHDEEDAEERSARQLRQGRMILNSMSTESRRIDYDIEFNSRRQTSLPSTRAPSVDPLPSLTDSHPSLRPSSRASHRSDSLLAGPSNRSQRLQQLHRFRQALDTRSPSISSSTMQGRPTNQRLQPIRLQQTPEVIDLTDDDVDISIPLPRASTAIPSRQAEEDELDALFIEDDLSDYIDTDSDVEITDVRELPPDRRAITTLHLSPQSLAGQRPSIEQTHRPPSLTRANAQSFTNSQGGFGRGILNQVSQFMRGVGVGGMPTRNQETIDLIDALDDDPLYDDITFDHGIMDQALRFEDPAADELARARAEPEYKAPAKARSGFTRDIAEEPHVLVCASCEEELGMGDDEDVRAQVWVSRKCGHVYCGGCNQRRVVTRGGNDRSRKKAKMPKIDELRACAVASCDVKLTSKTAMFQIYL